MNLFIRKVDFDRAGQQASEDQVHDADGRDSADVRAVCGSSVKLYFSYLRFLENQMREAFGFRGSPIWIRTGREILR
jgi:GTP-binding protein